MLRQENPQIRAESTLLSVYKHIFNTLDTSLNAPLAKTSVTVPVIAFSLVSFAYVGDHPEYLYFLDVVGGVVLFASFTCLACVYLLLSIYYNPQGVIRGSFRLRFTVYFYRISLYFLIMCIIAKWKYHMHIRYIFTSFYFILIILPINYIVVPITHMTANVHILYAQQIFGYVTRCGGSCLACCLTAVYLAFLEVAIFACTFSIFAGALYADDFETPNVKFVFYVSNMTSVACLLFLFVLRKRELVSMVWVAHGMLFVIANVTSYIQIIYDCLGGFYIPVVAFIIQAFIFSFQVAVLIAYDGQRSNNDEPLNVG